MPAGLTALFPGALALAALVPVIWWLHRARPHGEPLEVASVSLFRGDGASQVDLEPRHADRSDLAWIRRALLVLALAASLAGLHLLKRTPPVIVWIDGSPSMQAREHGATRLQTALTELDRELAARRVTAVTLRSLARPAFELRVRVPFEVGSVAQQLPAGEPVFPEPAALDPSAEHWLVTDGANDGLSRWLPAAPIEHLVRAGTLTENVAVTALAYRPSLVDEACGDVIVTVYDAGLAQSRRRLDLTAPPCRIKESVPTAQPISTDLTLQSGEMRTLHFTVGPPPFRIEARLSPADALPDDDGLTLGVAQPLTTRVAVDPGCGRALQAAAQADPALATAPPQDAQLLVDCSFRWRGSPLPRLVVHPAARPRPLTQPLHWSWPRMLAESGPLPAETPDTAPAGMLASGEPLAVAAGGQAVLSAGSRPLAVLHPGPPRRVDTVLDLQDGEAASQRVYPLLIASLLDVTAGEVLTERVARVARAPGETRIAPDASALARRPRARPAARAPIAAAATSDLTPVMLVLAVLLACWELAAAARALAAVRRYYSGGAP